MDVNITLALHASADSLLPPLENLFQSEPLVALVDDERRQVGEREHVELHHDGPFLLRLPHRVQGVPRQVYARGPPNAAALVDRLDVAKGVALF